MRGKALKLAIVDDQDDAIIAAREKLDKTFELPQMKDIKYDLDIYKGGFELLSSETEYDLILIDYDMSNMNGLGLAIELNKLRPKPRFVFLTSYDMPAKEMFDVFPSGYIYKSNPLEEFQRVIAGQIEKILDQKRIEIIYYQTESYEMEYKGTKEMITEAIRKTKLLNIKDIALLETGISKKVKTSYIYTINGDVYLTHKPMSYWLTLLPEDEFVHSSKVNAVGLRHVESISGSEIIFNSDEIEPINLTRTLKEKFKVAHHYYTLEVEDD